MNKDMNKDDFLSYYFGIDFDSNKKDNKKKDIIKFDDYFEVFKLEKPDGEEEKQRRIRL